MPHARTRVNAQLTAQRRVLLRALGAAGLITIVPARAQQTGKVWRIGILLPRARPAVIDADPVYRALAHGMRDLGYIDGKNASYQWKFADGRYEQLPRLAAELVQANVDVIIAVTSPCVRAAKQATTTIPIVMVAVGDPVALGFVTSYARPGGNLTGVSNSIDDVSSKYIELLRAAVPRLTRVAVLVNPVNPNTVNIHRQIEASAKSGGIAVMRVEAKSAAQLVEGIAAARKGRAAALIVQADSLFFEQRSLIASETLKQRMPTMFWNKDGVDTGGLMSYGSNNADDFRRASRFADRILKGTHPRDLPVEQPIKFEFAINRKTATALGLKIPQELLLRADEVIE